MNTKTLALVGALGALAIPGAAGAQESTPPSPTQNASETCKAERTAIGRTAFNQKYGIKAKSRGIGKCVSKLRPDEADAIDGAAQECRDERTAMGDEAFANKYGTNKNKNNAFGKCVSGKSKAAHVALKTAHVKAVKNAARECKAERTADPAAFKAKYRNFGKCVSARAKAQNHS